MNKSEYTFLFNHTQRTVFDHCSYWEKWENKTTEAESKICHNIRCLALIHLAFDLSYQGRHEQNSTQHLLVHPRKANIDPPKMMGFQ